MLDRLFYGRRINRRPGIVPGRMGDLRPSLPVSDEIERIENDSPRLIPEVAARSAPAAPQRGRRGVPRAKPRA